MRRAVACLIGLALSLTGPPAQAQDLPEPEVLRQWIAEMKADRRGPFSGIRWFCNDGTVLPPRPSNCKAHGGGRQHGLWSERTRTLRDNGYLIANVIAAIDPERVLDDDFYDEYKQILLEQFLVGIDNGWILRQARFYRGAFQAEGESRNARRILARLANHDPWIRDRLAVLRIGLRMLPHGREGGSVSRVRQLSADLAHRDQRFVPLRNKIHARPEHADHAAVRRHAQGVDDPALRGEFLELAALIDEVYGPKDLSVTALELAARLDPGRYLKREFPKYAPQLRLDASPGQRFAASAALMAAIREGVREVQGATIRVDILDFSLALEDAHFAAANELHRDGDKVSRRTRLDWLRDSLQAVYGAGLISPRQREAWLEAAAELDVEPLTVGRYKRTLEYLGRVPAWGSLDLRRHFFETMQAWQTLEPNAMLFVQDQLRGSPLFGYTRLLDDLTRDANRLAGVEHSLFGAQVGVGVRGLNPGLASGVLRLSPGTEFEDFERDGIYLLPETVADLPPVAGILTAGEGNPLSHIQLLARNLGIPNVSIDENLIARLAPYDGRRVRLAVSPGGVVELSEQGAAAAASERGAEVLIRPDLDKLDLGVRRLIPLSELRAEDSGRIVGPKAAKLGELKHHYPEAVEEGLAIPFGVFRALLDRPMPGTGGSIYEWMVGRYRTLAVMPGDSPQRAVATERFRARLERTIEELDPGPAFRAELRAALARVFGEDGSYGVFVRSDTNVEDLPGFTGAGLNLTVPNVVGFEAIAAAIPRVWASPFSARAFAWRQARMDRPEHVYPAVLLLRSVPADKSGVLVTQDIDSGSRQWLSVAVNEGVGGAVDGQAAESLRIDVDSGEVKLLAQATAPWRRRVRPDGGIDKVPVSNRDYVLTRAEIDQLIRLARDLPRRFPSILDDRGRPAPADIEFGFVDGELKLFQIRPFLESKHARASSYLAALDAASAGRLDVIVDLEAIPT